MAAWSGRSSSRRLAATAPGVERAVETVEQALELYGAARLRAQADRPQPPRRARPRGARRDLRRRGDRGARGRDGRLLGARRRAVGARERRRAAAEHDRRDLPARHEGARAGAALRRRRLHGRPDRPRRARGGRRDDGRGARLDRARRVGRTTSRRSTFAERTHGSPTSRRRRCRSTRRARSSPRCARRFPAIHAPKKEDICYATSNRQWAVKEMLRRDRPAARDRLAQLVELEPARRGRARGRRRVAPDRRRDRDRRGVARRRRDVGVTSGASAPEQLVERVCDWFRARGVDRHRAVPDGRRGRRVPPARRASPRAALADRSD